MAAPSIPEVTAYLGTDNAETPADIAAAYAAEKGAQARVCRVPADAEVWPPDLAEALCRRVQHNLALRNNPLGVSIAFGEGGAAVTRVGGLDAEVRRLEAPWRKAPVG